MKWSLALLLSIIIIMSITVLPVHATISITGGGGGGVTYSAFSETITIFSGNSKVSQNGATLSSLAWLNPSYVSVSGNNLQILPQQSYISNNASMTLNTNTIALNVTFEPISSTYPFGTVGIGYGTYFQAGDEGNYEPNPPYYDAGIVVILEHGAMSSYHLFVFYDGQLWGNFTVGSLTSGEQIMLGFNFMPPNNLIVYYYNGSVYKYTITPVVVTSTGTKAESLSTVNTDFIIEAGNGGPTFGYAQWFIVSYSYFEPATYTATLSYTAVQLPNGVYALLGYIGAYNPLNISVSSSVSYTVRPTPTNLQNFSVTGSSYPVSGSISYVTKSNGLFLLINNMYPAPSINSWYINVTIQFQFTTPSQTVTKDITIPIFIANFAQRVSISLPQSSYISGQVVQITNTTYNNFPPNLGYGIASPAVSEVDVEGITSGYVPLPFSKEIFVNVQTTYTYIINVVEGGSVELSYEGSFTVYPAQKQPIIFVSQYPMTVTQGQTITLTFQFTYNSPISNVSQSAFVERSQTFAYAFAKIVSSQALSEFYAYWLSANDGLLIITQTTNYLLPFNGSAGIDFVNNTINELQISVTATHSIVVESLTTNTQIEIANTSPVIGIGFYYGAGALNLQWFFVDGIVLQSATANQAFTILTGTNPNTLTQYVSGYTNTSGFGSVTITLTDTPYELIDIYWSGVTYILLNITVNPSTSTTTTVTTSTLNYNYTNPFSNNIAPNSQLYNFSAFEPWSTVIGVVVTALVALLGWKFGGSGGALGGIVMGLITTAYLGLMPWYLFYIFIFAIALLLAKILSDKFLGGEE